MPDRTDRMNNVLGRQFIALGDLCFARGAAAERLAFGEEFAAGGAVDRTIDPAAAEQRCVRRIYDRVDRKLGDVADEDLEAGALGIRGAIRAGLHAWIVGGS